MSACSSNSGIQAPEDGTTAIPRATVAGLISSSVYKVEVVESSKGSYNVAVYIFSGSRLYLMCVVNMHLGDETHAFTTIKKCETGSLEKRWKVYVQLFKLEGTTSFTLYLFEKLDYHSPDGSIVWEVTSPPAQYTALIRLGVLAEAAQFFGACV